MPQTILSFSGEMPIECFLFGETRLQFSMGPCARRFRSASMPFTLKPKNENSRSRALQDMSNIPLGAFTNVLKVRKNGRRVCWSLSGYFGLDCARFCHFWIFSLTNYSKSTIVRNNHATACFWGLTRTTDRHGEAFSLFFAFVCCMDRF